MPSRVRIKPLHQLSPRKAIKTRLSLPPLLHTQTQSSPTQQQGGGLGGGQPPHPVPEQDERFSRSRETTTTTHNRFNTLRMRRTFAVPTPGNVPNIATFYRDVIGIIQELADEARSQARRNDVIQLEVVGENVRNHVAVTVDDQGENILPAFEELLDRIVQSNSNIAADENIELIVQVAQNPRGGCQTQAEENLRL
ncbi:uncharacterized protein AKAME5_002209300 [Lates japonicus]|uniref:Uncharacterized protein n=1 Tax=Lates japonicus TaxID=270547 RepID=A0AAD3NFH7_LATJO|nr:uncharacterized protein AKAME5_002209300 [Lates japonicus]